MQNYKKLNNIVGWLVFLLAATVYIMTAEPTASFWDCGEYIATSYKLQVGHPPGAPTFQLMAKIFSLFAPNTSEVAFAVNVMSALASAFTILFLFWTITHLAKKIIFKDGEFTMTKMVAVLGAGLVGSLAYTFSDSFWFSAVEGEVYATSSFFTAVVFWAILKWEDQADDPKSYRWLVLIAYLIGLSVGVHLLNLLTIPAIVLIFYYKKYTPTTKGVIAAIVISLLIVATTMYIIIPGIVWLSGMFELLFVNSFRLPFNSGTIIFFLLIIGLIIAGLRWCQIKGRVNLHTVILSLTFLLIGYSTFLILVIRSNAETPINENSPKNAISLLAYLNREQYGSLPLFYGPYYNAPYNDRKDWKNGSPIYERDDEKGKYVVTDDRKKSIPTYDSRFCTVFPRMWSNQEAIHEREYKSWGYVKGTPVRVNEGGESKVLYKPTFGENLTYFMRYQIGHMYFRYFFWNFVGRQNDIQGHGSIDEGNWESGIPFIDKIHLGDQSAVPDHMKHNEGKNHYYFLPLLLGLLGLFYHLNRHSRDTLVVTMLFLMTGLAIVVYLNQYPYQPRERDYAYVGSFYAFAIWIGLGVLALYELMRKYVKGVASAALPTLITLVLVPGIMANANWDDHNRSNRYTARDFAKNYLSSCAPNAILFTNGDNDTFPLWYVQEVEGFRTDVRVINMSLLNTDWYADQMKRQAYESAPVPISLNHNEYRQGTRDVIYLLEQENIQGHVNVKDLYDIMKKNPDRLKLQTGQGEIDYFPTKKFYIPVDSAKVVANGTVPKAWAGEVVDSVKWEVKNFALQKNMVFLLDILGHFNWDRPIYFAITTGSDVYFGLQDYFVQEGLTYRLVPVKTDSTADGMIGRVNTDAMYDNLMNKFVWGNMEKDNVYLDETNSRMTMNFRNNFSRLALALLDEGKKDKALKVLNRCMEIMPESRVPYNYFALPIAEGYYRAGDVTKANQIIDRLITQYTEDLKYVYGLSASKAEQLKLVKQQALYILQQIMQMTERYKQTDMFNKAKASFEPYYRMYIGDVR